MTKSFDSKLEETHKKKKLDLRTDIWQEGTQEFNHKLCIAEDLLQVTWLSEYKDHNLEAARGKKATITDLRNAIEQMSAHINSFNSESENKEYFTQHGVHSCLVLEKVLKAHKVFSFVDLSGAFQLLYACLNPTKIHSLGEGSEMFHTNTKYHKLLQLSALYGFKLNVNVAISKITNNSSSLTKEVAKLLESSIKPDNFSGLELRDNESMPYIRVKFGQEDKVDVEKAHPDFLKVVALIRMFHGTLLKGIKPSDNHATQIDRLVTYGLLTEKNSVRVIGIKAFVPQTSRDKKSYKYQLFNVGVFPLEPSTEEDKTKLDELISFLLEASRQTIAEENQLIKNITKESVGKRRMKSCLPSTSAFSKGDQLLIGLRKSKDSLLETTITLDEYLYEISSETKDIFYGVLEDSSPVYVKIFLNESYRYLESIPIGNIFLSRKAKVSVNNVSRKEYIEISIAGVGFSSVAKRSREDKMHIITQLLLEMDHIHTNKIIHNDIKPSNIIILEKEWLNKETVKVNQQEPSFYCKFIDFELAMTFDTEDGDVCSKDDGVLESTGGTPSYNAPEKEMKDKNNCIHPKTDIYSLGLIFIELIIEKDVDKKLLENENGEIWQIIETKCNQLDSTKGQIIFNMIKNMVAYKRKDRIIARECLKLLDITEKVETQNHTLYFFPKIASGEGGEKKRKRKEEDEVLKKKK
ncbi:hypothetical protein ABK040_010889 [Willaertia magna]